MTQERLEALPEGTYFTLTEDPDSGARHLFFRGHYDIPYEKIRGFHS